MKTVTSISGGKTSAYLAAEYPSDYNVFALVRTDDKNCLYPDKKLRQIVEDRIQKPFIGTLEDDVIITTILELEQYLGRRIDWVSGDTFEEIIKSRGNYLPNKMARYCTTYLKTFPIAHWLKSNNLNPCIMQFGYRANEGKRARKMENQLNERGFVEVKIPIGNHDNGNIKWQTIDYQKPSFPLISDGIFKSDIEKYWRLRPVSFAELNNCVGCHWRNELLLAKMFREHPNKMEWFNDQEKQSKGTFKTGITYDKIKNYPIQHELDFSDFSDCDSGYCGL